MKKFFPSSRLHVSFKTKPFLGMLIHGIRLTKAMLHQMSNCELVCFRKIINKIGSPYYYWSFFAKIQFIIGMYDLTIC